MGADFINTKIMILESFRVDIFCSEEAFSCGQNNEASLPPADGEGACCPCPNTRSLLWPSALWASGCSHYGFAPATMTLP